MESKSLIQSKRVALFGKIFTSNVQSKWAEVVIFENDLIVYAGDIKGAEQHLTQDTQQINIQEEFLVLPGFIDSHMHPLSSGLQQIGCPIETCCSFKEIAKKIKAFLINSPNVEWIFASGFTDPMFPEGKPNRKYLDEVCPDKPVVMMRYDCHAYLVNTKALEVTGITTETVSPPGGILEKDEEGNLTGVVHELAMNLLRPFFPKKTQEDFQKGFETAVDIVLRDGITGMMEASVKSYRFPAYNNIFALENETYPRTSISLYWGKDLQERVDSQGDKKFKLSEITGIKETERLKVNTVKFFVDGVLDSQTALLEEPYLGVTQENYHGMQNFEEEHLKKYVSILHNNGIQAHFHVIGDKAIRIALDAIEYAKKNSTAEYDPRHYLAHVHLPNPKDYKRFKELNVAANFSPAWFWYDSSVELTASFLGPERSKLQYPIKDLINEGVVITFGSDWPVSTHRPLDGIETAVTRKEAGNKNPETQSWCPEQCLTVEEAVLAYTINSAYVLHQENSTGSLEKGKKADIIVLNRNIFECEPSNISETKVRLTILDGKVVYNSLDVVA